MSHSTKRLAVALIFILLVGSFYAYTILHRPGKAEDLLGLQGVTVCTTSQDTQPGQQRCPSPAQYVTNCPDARAALSNLPGIQVASQTNQPLPHIAECELKPVNAATGLYVILIHAYTTTASTSQEATSQLYAQYSNLYQVPPLTDSSTLSAVGFPLFTAGFLVQGEPGFRMMVTTQDQNGVVHPGAGTLIKMSCGAASDTMVAEPNGTSWFSFAGYQKLNCADQPLVAQVMVEKDATGRWLPQTPTYNYLYTPESSPTLDFQNSPQPAQVFFTGKWQGIGVQVLVTAHNTTGSSHAFPLAKTQVSFSCDQKVPSPSPSEDKISLNQVTNAKGQASMALADAELALQGCTPERFQASLTSYNTPNHTVAKSDPTYDYYFAQPGPVPVARFSGNSIPTSIIAGHELEVGGNVRIADVGATPGGFLPGSTVCLFYSPEAAKAVSGCPDHNSSTSLTVQANLAGFYVFGGDTNNRLSYGDYANAGSPVTVVRIVNYKNEAYPDTMVEHNNTPLILEAFNQRDIKLPSTQQELQNHVCLNVIRNWKNPSECQPLYNIIFHESGWNVAATNSSSGACGLFQANPCEKYQQTALVGEDYHAIGNQIRWGIAYIKDRYGDPANAWAFWQAHSNY